MSARAFSILIIGVLALGLVVGGGLVAATSLGGDKEEEAPATLTAPQFRSSGQTASAGITDSQSLDQLREQSQSGEATPDDLAQFRQQLQGQFGQGGGGLGGPCFSPNPPKG